jgi:hypothetical protein
MTAALSNLIKNMKATPSLVVLDTWSRALGGDDSDTGDSAAGLAALDAFRKRFNQVATVIVHHEGHTGGRPRGWSGLHAAVDNEYRAERGNDEILRLTCTKAKEARRMDPIAFEFADVDLGITNEDGEPVTSAVLNQVEYYPDTGTGKDEKKVLGKNQALALDLLKKLYAEKPPGASVTSKEWRDICIEQKIARQRFYEIKDGLEQAGFIILDGLFVFLKNPGDTCTDINLSVSCPSGGVSKDTPRTGRTNVRCPKNVRTGQTGQTGQTDTREDVKSSTPFNALDVPKGIPPEEYRECYNAAYSAFINEGLTADEADRKAREEIKNFIAGYDLSGAAVSSPVTPDEEIDF